MSTNVQTLRWRPSPPRGNFKTTTTTADIRVKSSRTDVPDTTSRDDLADDRGRLIDGLQRRYFSSCCLARAWVLWALSRTCSAIDGLK